MPKAIDLTMPLDEGTPVFPGDPKPEFEQTANLGKEGYNEKTFRFASHFGTHIDAPYHMLEEGMKLDEFQPEKFFGEAITIDARKTNGSNEIMAGRKELDRIRKNDIVLFWTGHMEKAGTGNFFKNNPVIPKSVAELLVQKRVKMVGIDSFSPDNPPYETHKTLLASNILIVENLVSLEKLEGKLFTCFMLPLRITDADGAPCRAIAILP